MSECRAFEGRRVRFKTLTSLFTEKKPMNTDPRELKQRCVTLTDPGSPVTLVIVSYNHARFLETALESVARQELLPGHLIVVDDASSDASASVIRRYLHGARGNITALYHQTNRGLLRTLNETLALVDSDFVAFMAADDWMEPARFSRQLVEFEMEGPACALVHSDMFRADEHGKRLEGTHWTRKGRSTGDIFLDCVQRCAIGTPSALIRSSALRAVGGYDESLMYEDYDMWLQLSRRYKISYIDAPLVTYREVSTSMSNSWDLWQSHLSRLNSLMKHLDLQGDHGSAVQRQASELIRTLYLQGRAPRQTASDTLRVVFAHKGADPLMLLLLLVSGVRVPGRWIDRMLHCARHKQWFHSSTPTRA